MLNLNDVLNCRRVMVYRNQEIEYTTGLCNEVYLNTEQCLNLVQGLNINVNYMEDFLYMLRKHNCIGKSVSMFDDNVLINYLYDNNINIDSMILLTEKVKSSKVHDLNKFLKEAKETINKYGIYVPEPKMKHWERRKNTEKNLAMNLDMNALSDAAYRSNVYDDNFYLELADSIHNIVFKCSLESNRIYFNMMYEDYVSDYITDEEYDMIAYCCEVANYLMKYSDIGVYGLEVFMENALNVAMEGKHPVARNVGRSESNVMQELFDKADYNLRNNEDDYKVRRRTNISDEEVEEFRKYI